MIAVVTQLTVATGILIIVFINVLAWMVREIHRAPLIEDHCDYCRDTGYQKFEVWKNADKPGSWPTLEMHERPCHCTAGIGKERRRVA